MAKQAGMGDNLYVAGYNLSGDTGSLSRIGGGATVLEVTGIDKSAFERLLGVRDGAIEFNSWFNPGTDQAHDVLSTIPVTDRYLTYCRGTTLGNPAAALKAKQIGYDGTRAPDGGLSFAVSAQANEFGIEWGRQLTAGLRTDVAATDGSSIDTAASAAFGLQAYLHVTAFTGTDVTITIEDSANDADFLPVTAAEFTEVTAAPAVERLQTARNATVRRYLRVVTSGTFDSVTFSVVVVKNETTVNF